MMAAVTEMWPSLRGVEILTRFSQQEVSIRTIFVLFVSREENSLMMTLKGSLRKHFVSTKFSRKFKVEGKKFPSMQQLIGCLLREAQLCVWVCGGNNYGGERCFPFTG